ncbi:MAG: F0F1 ATP synthase subunit A [Polyangiaceae bacterium]|nr:F0F1 ATP synthase subunit A [Myxococcales bacterium]MCB9589267.1 F0F1 ATP synthase subunit A [Polyangiaceae bacterium]
MGHYSWLTLLLEKFKGNLSRNAHMLGESFVGNRHGTWEDFEPITASLLIAVLLILIGMRVRSKLTKLEEAVVPDDELTLRTFMEAFLGYFYDLAKSVMDADRAKKYFPLIASSACFVFFANLMALIPGMPVPTSNLSITAGSALVVFVAFNAYGIMVNGGAYIKHLAGPSPMLAPLMFPIEVISLCVRPVTLAVRLMVNMAVDHLVLTTFMALVAIIVPIPVMLLGCIVVVVQTLVFTLLTTIYIGLATEDMHHHH